MSESAATTSIAGRRLALPGGVVVYNSPAEWDQLIQAHDGQLLQSWAWGELKSHFGWKAWRLSGPDGSSAQLLIRRHRGLAVGYVPRGPVFTDPGADLSPLLEAIEVIARAERAAFVRIEPGIVEGTQAAEYFDASARSVSFRPVDRTLQLRSTVQLDLRPTPEELLARCSKGHRADIKRARRLGVSVRVGEQDGDIDVLHAMLRATLTRKSFDIRTAEYYRRLWRTFGLSAQLLLAEHEGEIVAASLVLAWGAQSVYLIAGATRAGLDCRAVHLMQWEAINWVREQGATTWDLGGIADARARLELARGAGQTDEKLLAALEHEAKQDPLDSLFRFKKGWGGHVVRWLPAYDRVFFAPAYLFWRWRQSGI